jgi:hypothetical protein
MCEFEAFAIKTNDSDSYFYTYTRSFNQTNNSDNIFTCVLEVEAFANKTNNSDSMFSCISAVLIKRSTVVVSDIGTFLRL